MRCVAEARTRGSNAHPYSRFCIVLLAAACATACGRLGSPSSPKIHFNQQLGTIDVSGIPERTLALLASRPLEDDEWQSLLRVAVKKDAATGNRTQQPAVAGKYGVDDDLLRFVPLFPWDEGRQYEVTFDPARLPGPGGSEPWRSSTLTEIVGLPASGRKPTATVTHVYPSSGIVPANQLRLYLHFSEPMDQRSGRDHVMLLDEHGQEVVDAFLPLEADFWNGDRTRYTVFFDPGRVKRGILPNRQMGRALEPGKRYTLVVKSDWRDGYGKPLMKEFRHELRAGPAVERALSMEDWRIDTPQTGTRSPLVVTFPAPLDHGLLGRALSVSRGGAPVDGDIAIGDGERTWRLTPREAWAAGEYELVALEFLEDLAGNRVGRAFEVDSFERTDVTSEPARRTRRFRIPQ